MRPRTTPGELMGGTRQSGISRGAVLLGLVLALIAVIAIGAAMAGSGTFGGPASSPTGLALGSPASGSGLASLPLTPGPSLANGSPGGSPRSSAGPSASPGIPKLLFGLGTEAQSAANDRLVRDAPVRMLSSWFNGSADLAWMSGWSSSVIPAQYAAGRSLHLIMYASSSATAVTPTAYGPACGRPYPLSAQFQSDAVALAKTWAGKASGPPLYVTMFTEFQTYACHQGAWLPDEAYWRALKDAYTAAAASFRRYAPNARVSLGWGGWQERWDDPATGGGRSMLGHFADVMAASDFQSFQAMQSDTNVADVLAMTTALHAWGPVMLAHYKPDDGSQVVFDADTSAMLTDGYLRQATAAGLFAWSFMDATNMSAEPAAYDRVVAAVRRYGN